jgi:hypothetical protein
LGFPTKTLYAPLLSPVLATFLVHLILDLITRIYRSEYRAWSSSLYSLLNFPVTSSYFGPNVLLSTLLSNIFSLCSSLNVRSQASHPYIEHAKIYYAIQWHNNLIWLFITFILVFAIPECCNINNNIKLLTV